MKKWFVCFLSAILCLGLMGCGAEKADQPVSCGHEKYLSLIDSLEAEDYAAARRMIDSMEGDTAAASEPAAAEKESTTASEPKQETLADSGAYIELTFRNFLDYFEIREDLIFENPVQYYQSIQLREEYKDRILDIQNVSVEVSFFDSHAYGELDHEDQLFFPEYYDMVTGELAFRKVEIGNNGEGFLSLASYKKGCFHDYMMDIAITEATGRLILKTES